MHGPLKNKVQFYLSRMRARGFGAAAVLEGTDLDEQSIGAASFYTTPDSYRRIIANMLRLTGNPRLGIQLGSEFKVSDLGVLGYAALSSATLAQARHVIHRYYALNEYILIPSNFCRDGRWYSELRESLPLGPLLPFAVEEFISRTIALSTSLTSRPFPILKIGVTYAEPERSDDYQRAFRCPVCYDQPRNVIEFDIERLQDPVTLSDHDVFTICDQQCRLLIEEQDQRDRLADTIQRILLNMPGRFPSLAGMAERLGVSARTLRRQLQQEGVTYQQTLDATRRSLAEQYLQHTSLTPKEIGFLLGYANVSHFRRAFRNWTGRRVSEYSRHGSPRRGLRRRTPLMPAPRLQD
ncbi:MAG: AraC family transcriptional regulator [Gammaproteobacteria bacterium]|nr:AraC family transcriptional regulator [Gammaproteobacteria bacterium]